MNYRTYKATSKTPATNYEKCTQTTHEYKRHTKTQKSSEQLQKKLQKSKVRKWIGKSQNQAITL